MDEACDLCEHPMAEHDPASGTCDTCHLTGGICDTVREDEEDEGDDVDDD
jgi:hypothetical protein